MESFVDLDLAVAQIEQRTTAWQRAGISVGAVWWRDQGEGWPPKLKTDRSLVLDGDSVGLQLRRGQQEGEVVLFKGGWCDFVYWSGDSSDEPLQDAPGYPDSMTVEGFGDVLDRLAALLTT